MDWILSINTIIAMELIARRKWHGWAVGLLNQGLWFYVTVWQQHLYGLALITGVLT